jgi:DNA-binding NtrC family response regulator
MKPCATGERAPDAAEAQRTTVLLVEDDFLLRTMSIETLGDFGYDVVDAANADEALALLTERPEIGLLMTDIRLPGVGGVELAMQATRSRPDLRVLFASGYEAKSITGVDSLTVPTAFIAKPYKPEQLEVILRDLLIRRPA